MVSVCAKHLWFHINLAKTIVVKALLQLLVFLQSASQSYYKLLNYVTSNPIL